MKYHWKNLEVHILVIQCNHMRVTWKWFMLLRLERWILLLLARVNRQSNQGTKNLYTLQFLFEVAQLNYSAPTVKWAYASCANKLSLSYMILILEVLWEFVVSCARCLNEFWGQCSNLAPVTSLFSSLTT